MVVCSELGMDVESLLSCRWAPFLWQCTIFMLLFVGPNGWASSSRCFAKLEVWLLL